MQLIQMPYVCGSVLNRSEQLFFSLTPDHDIGFLIQFFPSVILSTVIQNNGNHLISGTKTAGVSLPRMTDVRTWDKAVKAVVAGYLKGQKSALVVNNS